MTTAITSAYPHVEFNGFNDQSVLQQKVVEEQIPTHLPKVFIYAQRGTLKPSLVVGQSRIREYGAETFEPRGKFTNHQTILSNVLNMVGNQHIVQRIVPPDIGPAASVRISLEVVEGDLPKYTRNVDGSFAIDTSGLLVPDGVNTVRGVKVRFVVEDITETTGPNSFGQGTSPTGTLTLNGSTATKYPILDVRETSQGSDGNNTGIRMFMPNINSTMPVKQRLIADDSFYPVYVGLVRRNGPNTTGNLQPTNFGASLVELGFHRGVFDSTAQDDRYFGDRFIENYVSDGRDGTPAFDGYIDKVHLYDDNIETLTKMFYEHEKAFIAEDINTDFDGHSENDYRRFNWLSGVSSNGRPYETYQFDSESIRMTESTNIYLRGGTDGTMSKENFNNAVAAEFDKYLNPNEEVAYNVVRHPESVFYDTGFPMFVKKKMVNVLGLRGDISLYLSVYSEGMGPMDAITQTSVAVALSAVLDTMPESPLYGTPVARGYVVGRSGTLVNSNYRERLPMTIDLAYKRARYMGAGNGMWNNQKQFDISPANQVELLENIDITSTPAKARIKDWDLGMIYVEDFTKKVAYYPSFHSTYREHTSTLKSMFMVDACCDLVKKSWQLHREFTGNSELTDAQFTDRVGKRMNELVKGRYGNRFVIQPQAVITAYDKSLGFAWTSIWDIGGNTSKTVQNVQINVKRISDMVNGI